MDKEKSEYNKPELKMHGNLKEITTKIEDNGEVMDQAQSW